VVLTKHNQLACVTVAQVRSILRNTITGHINPQATSTCGECWSKGHPCRAPIRAAAFNCVTNTWGPAPGSGQYPSERKITALFAEANHTESRAVTEKRHTSALCGRNPGVSAQWFYHCRLEYTQNEVSALSELFPWNAICALCTQCAARGCSTHHGAKVRRAEPWAFGSRVETSRVRNSSNCCDLPKPSLAHTVFRLASAPLTNWTLPSLRAIPRPSWRAFRPRKRTGLLGANTFLRLLTHHFSFLSDSSAEIRG